MSNQPDYSMMVYGPDYIMPSRIHIHNLDNDSLLQIFSSYRQQDGDDWHLRHTWWRLAHVCRRWRYLVYCSSFHLDIYLRLTNNSPSISTLSHLPSLPLVIDYSDGTRVLAWQDEDNIHFGLQQHGRVVWVSLQGPSSTLHMLLQLMNRPFSRLRDLSLLSTTTDEMSLVLPETFRAPFLDHLSLQGIGLPRGLSLLSSMITLSTLSLTHIPNSCYFPPVHLATQLQGLPYLRELSVGFVIPIPLPSSEGELLPTPIPPVTLPALKWLTFRGASVYLDNLAAQINTPLLEQLSLTLFFEVAFTFVNLAAFIHRIKGFRCLVSRVIFDKHSTSIDYYEHWDTGKSSLHVNINCQPLDWQIDSATQVCTALGNVLSTVEELVLDINVDGMPLDWQNILDNILWHELLLPFIKVKKLRIGSLLTLELSQALRSVAGELVLEILPELQELEVQLEVDYAKKEFSGFVVTRESIGRPVHLFSLQQGSPEVRALSLIASTY